MSRRKKRSTPRKRSRSRKMGAVKGQLMDILGLAVGGAVGTIVAKKLFPNIDEKIKNAGVIAIGGFLFPKLVKGAIGQNIGNGMVVAGSIGLLQSFNVIGAVTDYMNIPVMAGTDGDISLIAGPDSQVLAGDNLAVMAGEEEDDYNY